MHEEESKLNRRLEIVFIFAVIFSIIVIIPYFVNFSGFISNDQNHWGLFGDYLGGVLNPVLGFFGLLALLFTISLQSKELRLSVQELEKSSNALNRQNLTLDIQRFENTFFQMLRIHNDLLNSIDFQRGGGKLNVVVTRGRDCFEVMRKRLDNSYKQEIKAIPSSDELELITKSYKKFYNEHKSELGHYFRYLYNIFKFIDNSNVENKSFYTNLVRAQLSDAELAILFYNCLNSKGKEKFKPLVEKYSIFKNMPNDYFLHGDHIKYYNRSAFKRMKK
jgi:Putative phage abortive infection protein